MAGGYAATASSTFHSCASSDHLHVPWKQANPLDIIELSGLALSTALPADACGSLIAAVFFHASASYRRIDREFSDLKALKQLSCSVQAEASTVTHTRHVDDPIKDMAD